MFTYYYLNKVYRFWKSGFLLDFFFKRFCFSILLCLYYVFNILFSEKYIIEHNFLKILLYIDYYRGLFNNYSQYFSFYLVGFVWLFSCFIYIYLSV